MDLGCRFLGIFPKINHLTALNVILVVLNFALWFCTVVFGGHMLSSVEIKPDVYFVGALDWNAREFHGYTTEQGITYNAYLILDEEARH